jgi:hypothetical protein
VEPDGLTQHPNPPNTISHGARQGILRPDESGGSNFSVITRLVECFFVLVWILFKITGFLSVELVDFMSTCDYVGYKSNQQGEGRVSVRLPCGTHPLSLESNAYSLLPCSKFKQ